MIFFRQLVQLFLSPSRGWDDIAAANLDERQALNRGLWPLVGVVALSAWFQAVYVTLPSLWQFVPRMVVAALPYVLTFYVAVPLMDGFLQRVEAESTPHERKLFVTYSVGTMAAIGLLCNLLPPGTAATQFLPGWALVCIYKGKNYLGVAEDHSLVFLGMSALTIIVPVFLWAYLFGGIL